MTQHKATTILLGTRNKAKSRELLHGLQPFLQNKITCTDLSSFIESALPPEPEEHGQTFEENARIKAEYYAALYGLPTIGDDAGIEIDVLNGQPGVLSKRWINGGPVVTDDELIEYTRKRLQSIPEKQATARLIVSLCYYNPATKYIQHSTEYIEGFMSKEPSAKRQAGFPYRALFKVKGTNLFYDELSPAEHARLNHRLRAAAKLGPYVARDLLQYGTVLSS